MSHEPHIESIWNQARGLKDGTPNPAPASVVVGPSSALRASAPEGQRVPLHCPHCASDPEIVETAIDDVWWVRCTNRDCIRHHPQPYGREAAIAAWNCRAPVNHAASVEAGPSRRADAPLAPEDHATSDGDREAVARTQLAYFLGCDLADARPGPHDLRAADAVLSVLRARGRLREPVKPPSYEAQGVTYTGPPLQQWNAEPEPRRGIDNRDRPTAQSKVPAPEGATMGEDIGRALADAAADRDHAFARLNVLKDKLAAAEAQAGRYRAGLIEVRALVDRVWHGRVGGSFAYDVIDNALGDDDSPEYHRIATALGCHVHDDLAAKCAAAIARARLAEETAGRERQRAIDLLHRAEAAERDSEKWHAEWRATFDKLAAAEAQAGRWIPVGEQLPPDEGCPPDDEGWPTTYMTFPHFRQACYFDGAWRSFNNDKDAWTMCFPRVTHWRPMPPAPGGSSGEGA